MKLNKIITVLAILLTNMVLSAADRPNIVWIVSEDNGIKWIGSYGGENTKTPNIDDLAKQGFRYKNCFDNAAVCAPTRSTWTTRSTADAT